MRMTSRTILGAWLIFAAAGCGSKPGPTPQAEATPGAGTEPSPATKVVHELDPARHVIPAGPVSGSVGGEEFTPVSVVEGDFLTFRTMKKGMEQPDREVIIRLRATPNQPLLVGRHTIRPEMPEGPEVPPIVLSTPGKPGHMFPNGYAMTLDLEPRKEGKLAGKVYLALPDDQKSYFAGTFVAAAPRLPIEPPGPEDVPLINGSVTVNGAGPKPVLITGYAASPNGASSQVGIAALDIELSESPDGPKWTQRNDDKPRVTSLIAGDGKKTPSRFEHSKLTPGRYLVFAALKDGPISWKWVDVGAQSTEKVDLVIDATKTGGLEATAPLGSLSKVQMAPADDPARPPLDTTLFELIAMQLKLEQDIVARKALFKNLGPGRYEVRDKASGQVRVVEIVAGKTVELDFDANPVPKKADSAPSPKPKG